MRNITLHCINYSVIGLIKKLNIWGKQIKDMGKKMSGVKGATSGKLGGNKSCKIKER